MNHDSTLMILSWGSRCCSCYHACVDLQSWCHMYGMGEHTLYGAVVRRSTARVGANILTKPRKSGVESRRRHDYGPYDETKMNAKCRSMYLCMN
jgi:hypothetical protein